MEFEIGVTSDFAVLSMQKKKTYKMSSLECSQKNQNQNYSGNYSSLLHLSICVVILPVSLSYGVLLAFEIGQNFWFSQLVESADVFMKISED